MITVILDEGRISKILTNPAFVKAFPFMKAASIAAQKKSCCRRSTVNKAKDYTALKRVIAGLPKAKKDELKKLLGADEVKMTYLNLKKVKTDLTF